MTSSPSAASSRAASAGALGPGRWATTSRRRAGAAARRAVDCQRSAMRGGDAERDRQAEAGAAGFRRARGIHAVEALAEPLEVLGWDTDAGIFDHQVGVAVGRRGAQRYRTA